MQKKFLALTAILLGATLTPIIAGGEDSYPNRPIKIVVPFTPATGADILARTLGQRLSQRWDQPVVVENRPGASGNIGTEAVAKSPADGYTLLLTANTIVLNRSLYKEVPYDPIKDFAPVAPLAIGNLALVTHPSVQAKSAKELIGLAKQSPGRINYGSPGNGTPHHLAMELFKLRAGIDLTHVPYKGTGGAVQDLLGGQIGVMFLPVHVALPLVESKRLNMLTAGGTHRSPAAAKVPSLAEATGIGDINVDIWYGLYAPAGTPKEVIDKLNGAVGAALRLSEVQASLEKQGLSLASGTSDRLAQWTRDDLEFWTRIVRDAKIQAD